MSHFKSFLYGLTIFLWGVLTFAKIYDCFISNPVPFDVIKRSDWFIIIGGPIIIILYIVSLITDKRKNKEIKE